MLDQLRAMGVFACVVEKNSFSGAARSLGITTSAVSQQIRSLEQEMEVTLLYRSTRKLSLTEAGQAFFHSCQEMLAAAERGRIRINELRDDLVGELRISTTPELAANHIVPALSHWMSAHRGLAVHLEADNQCVNLMEQRIDIALRLSSKLEETPFHVVPLARVALKPPMVASAPGSIGKNRPVDLISSLSCLRVTPGCTVTVRSSAFTASTLFMRRTSMLMPPCTASKCPSSDEPTP